MLPVRKTIFKWTEGMIHWLAGNIRIVGGKDFCWSRLAADKGGNIPGFFIDQQRLVPGKVHWHVVLYVAGEPAQAEQSGGRRETMIAP